MHRVEIQHIQKLGTPELIQFVALLALLLVAQLVEIDKALPEVPDVVCLVSRDSVSPVLFARTPR